MIRRTTVVLVLVAITALVACHPVPDTNPANPAAGLWLSRAELDTLGAVPSYVVSEANQTINNTDGAEILCGNDPNNSQHVLAAGIVAAKNNNATARTAVRNAIADVIGSEDGGPCTDTRQLGISRKLPGYVWGADLINLPQRDPTLNAQFTDWLWYLVNNNSGESECGSSGGPGGPGIIGCHLARTHNWGMVAGVARIVADSYMAVNDPQATDRTRAQNDLGFRADRTDARRVLLGQTGDLSAYNGWTDRSSNQPHACNPSTFATNGPPVNPGPPCDPPPAGGIDWNGGIPEDLDRGTRTPGTCSGTIDGHAFGAGNYHTGEVYAMWRWHKIHHEDSQADDIKNAGFGSGARVLGFFQRLRSSCGASGNYPTGDDQPWPFLVNKLYGGSAPTDDPGATGKVYSFTDYLPQFG